MNRKALAGSICGALVAIISIGSLLSRSIKFDRHTATNVFLIAFALAGVALVLWLVPKLQISGVSTLGSKERFDSESDARKSLAQLIGGLAFLATFYVTWSNFSLEREKATTEEFTKAVEQLSSADLPIRIGGAYGLERLSMTSPGDYENVMDVLTEWVRTTDQIDFDKRTMAAPNSPPRADEDKQRMIRILGRRTILSVGRDDSLRLNNADLRGINAQDAHFEWTNFDGSQLNAASFYRSHLAHAAFINAKAAVLLIPDPDIKETNKAQIAQSEKNKAQSAQAQNPAQNCEVPGVFENQLRVASFTLADLSDAILSGGDFKGASFNNAILTRANFENAQLQRAAFLSADLTGAVFRGAHIEGANFFGAKGVTSSTFAGALGDACTIFSK
jgi:uncharacterized protein YjbI with pentapeptide repeats